MKLYRKKLHSMDELLREKHVLKYALHQSKKDGLFAARHDKGKDAAEAKEGSSDILSIIGDLVTSKSALDAGLSIGLPLLKIFGRKAEKGIFKTLAGEILGGYVKWKAVQVGYRMVKKAVSHKHKKAEHSR